MTDFIDDLDLSVRAGNVLRKMGISDLEAFMALTKRQVMDQANAGARTWREVAAMRDHFRQLARKDRNARSGGPAYPIAGTYTHDTWPGMSMRDAAALVALQGMLAHATRYRPRPEDAGLHWHDALSREAFQIADAFITARETKGDDE